MPNQITPADRRDLRRDLWRCCTRVLPLFVALLIGFAAATPN